MHTLLENSYLGTHYPKKARGGAESKAPRIAVSQKFRTTRGYAKPCQVVTLSVTTPLAKGETESVTDVHIVRPTSECPKSQAGLVTATMLT